MKKLLLLVPFGLLMLATGCTSGVASRLAKMPDGQFVNAKVVETGKFTSTEIALGSGTKDNGLLNVEGFRFTHTNPWLIKFEFTADKYVVQLTATEKKKPLPPLSVVAPAK